MTDFKTVLIDVDGVLLDIHSELARRLRALGFNFEMRRVLTYDFNKSLPQELYPAWLTDTSNGVGDYCLNAPRNIIFDILGDTKLFEESKFYPKAISSVKELCRKGFDVCIYTQSFTDEIAFVKQIRLQMVLNDVNYRFVSVVGNNKPAIGHSVSYVIEDCPNNLFYYSGAELYLLRKPYNSLKYNPDLAQAYCNFNRVSSAQEAIKTILMKNQMCKGGF